MFHFPQVNNIQAVLFVWKISWHWQTVYQNHSCFEGQSKEASILWPHHEETSARLFMLGLVFVIL